MDKKLQIKVELFHNFCSFIEDTDEFDLRRDHVWKILALIGELSMHKLSSFDQLLSRGIRAINNAIIKDGLEKYSFGREDCQINILTDLGRLFTPDEVLYWFERVRDEKFSYIKAHDKYNWAEVQDLWYDGSTYLIQFINEVSYIQEGYSIVSPHLEQSGMLSQVWEDFIANEVRFVQELSRVTSDRPGGISNRIFKEMEINDVNDKYLSPIKESLVTYN